MERLLLLLAITVLAASAEIVPNVRWTKSLTCNGNTHVAIVAAPGKPSTIYIAGAAPVPSEFGPMDHGCVEKWVDGADSAEWTYVVGDDVAVAQHSVFNAITISATGDLVASGLIGNVSNLQISYGLLMALSPSNGTVTWSTVRPRYASDCALETRVIGSTAGQHLLALETDPCDTTVLAWIDAQSGKTVAHSILPGDVAFRGAKLSAEADVVYTLSFDGQINAYFVGKPQDNAKEIWSFGKGFQTMLAVAPGSDAAAQGGCVIASCVGVCGGTTLVSCNGKPLWVSAETSAILLAQSRQTIAAIATTPQLFQNFLMLSSIYAANGTMLWAVTAPEPLSPTIGGASFSSDGSGLFVLASSGNFRDKIHDLTIRFDGRTGENIWTAHVGTEQDLEGPNLVETSDPSLPTLMGVSIGLRGQTVWSIDQQKQDA